MYSNNSSNGNRRGGYKPRTPRDQIPSSAGWGDGDRRDFVKLNEGIVRDFGAAPGQLESVWGRGGPQACESEAHIQVKSKEVLKRKEDV